jgi:hypothetical protein
VNDNPDNVLSDSEKARIRAEEMYRAQMAAEAKKAHGLEQPAGPNLEELGRKLGAALESGGKRLAAEARKLGEQPQQPTSGSQSPVSDVSRGSDTEGQEPVASSQARAGSNTSLDVAMLDFLDARQRRGLIGGGLLVLGSFVPASTGFGFGIGANILLENGLVGLTVLLGGSLGIWFVLTRNYGRVRQIGIVTFVVSMIAFFQLLGLLQFLSGASIGSGFSYRLGPAWLLLLPGASMLVSTGFFREVKRK